MHSETNCPLASRERLHSTLRPLSTIHSTGAGAGWQEAVGATAGAVHNRVCRRQTSMDFNEASGHGQRPRVHGGYRVQRNPVVEEYHSTVPSMYSSLMAGIAPQPCSDKGEVASWDDAGKLVLTIRWWEAGDLHMWRPQMISQPPSMMAA